MVSVHVFITKEDYAKDEEVKYIESWMRKTMSFNVIHNTLSKLPERGIILIDFRLPKEELVALIKRVDESKKEKTLTSLYISIPKEVMDLFKLEHKPSINNEKQTISYADIMKEKYGIPKYEDLRAKYGLPHLHYAGINIEPGYKNAGHITNSYGLGLWGLSKMGKL